MTTWDPDDKGANRSTRGGARCCRMVLWCGDWVHPPRHGEGRGRATTTTPILTFAENHTPFEQIAFYVAGYEAEEIFKPPDRMFNQLGDWGEVNRILRENELGEELREQGRENARTRCSPIHSRRPN